jgi:hypothetical protein
MLNNYFIIKCLMSLFSTLSTSSCWVAGCWCKKHKLAIVAGNPLRHTLQLFASACLNKSPNVFWAMLASACACVSMRSRSHFHAQVRPARVSMRLRQRTLWACSRSGALTQSPRKALPREHAAVSAVSDWRSACECECVFVCVCMCVYGLRATTWMCVYLSFVFVVLCSMSIPWLSHDGLILFLALLRSSLSSLLCIVTVSGSFHV